jgi:uncharacterized membrane-anchored protein YjiN (DUF445 family)
MRRMATGLLLAMAVVFVGASLGPREWAWLAYVRAFAEAAIVGACADWFAVAALFRRPLGLPIPHTAVIPRKKQRIGHALGAFIADNFLTEPVLDERLRQMEVARWGGDWLLRPPNANRLARRLALVAPDVLASGPAGALGELAGSAGLAAARAAPAAPIAASLLSGLSSEGRTQAVIERAVEMLGGYITANQASIEAKVAEHSPGWLPGWVRRKLAAKISDGLKQTVEEMRAADHPWRRDLRERVETLIDRLRTDPKLQEKVEAWKLRLLADERLKTQGGELWEAVLARFSAELLADRRRLTEQLERALTSVGAWLINDGAAQGRLNTLGRSMAIGVLAPRRADIGRFIAQVVDSWDTRSVVDKLELQFGRDLQFIRINGTVVGGLVGLAIFAAARALGLK